MVDGSKPTEFTVHYNEDTENEVEHMKCPNCNKEAIYMWWIR